MAKVSADLVRELLEDASKATCPNCGGTGFYDNRNSPKRGKGPAFKCKNKECDDNGFPFGVFDRSLPKDAAVQKPGAAPRVTLTWSQVGKAYHECVAVALHEADRIKKRGFEVKGENVAAMAATLMISRKDANCWPALEAPAPKEPERDAEETYEYSTSMPF